MSEKHEVLLVDLDRIITKKHGDEAELLNLRLEDQCDLPLLLAGREKAKIWQVSPEVQVVL